jgi:hypothetical protein
MALRLRQDGEPRFREHDIDRRGVFVQHNATAFLSPRVQYRWPGSATVRRQVNAPTLDLFTTHASLFGGRICWHFQHSPKFPGFSS